MSRLSSDIVITFSSINLLYSSKLRNMCSESLDRCFELDGEERIRSFSFGIDTYLKKHQVKQLGYVSANMEIFETDFGTVILEIVKNRDVSLIRLLIEKYKLKPKALRMLSVACQYADLEIVNYLLSVGVKPTSEDLCYAVLSLNYYCIEQSLEVIKALVVHGAPITHVDDRLNPQKMGLDGYKEQETMREYWLSVK